MAGILDYETDSRIKFTVQASDNGLPRLSTAALVTVYLVDVNDNAPLFDLSNYRFEVTESSTSANIGPVGRVFASDADENGEASFWYQLDKMDVFKIDSKTGEIFPLQLLDREIRSEYEVCVCVICNHSLLCETSFDTPLFADRLL